MTAESCSLSATKISRWMRAKPSAVVLALRPATRVCVDERTAVDAVLGVDVERGLVGLLDVLAPADLDPAAGLLGTAALGRGVGTVGAVDGHAVAAGDEADDVIARNGRAALGELDEAVGKPLHHDAVLALFTHGNGGAGLARLAGDGHGGVALGLLLLIESLELVADAVDGLLRGKSAESGRKGAQNTLLCLSPSRKCPRNTKNGRSWKSHT